jgi:hypothetical protein
MANGREKIHRGTKFYGVDEGATDAPPPIG